MFIQNLFKQNRYKILFQFHPSWINTPFVHKNNYYLKFDMDLHLVTFFLYKSNIAVHFLLLGKIARVSLNRERDGSHDLVIPM